jgi:Domain of unknown function (DUF1707)/Transcriptional regulator PadR-like family
VSTRGTREATLLVLAVLAGGSQHGYGIISGVREVSGGRVMLRAGALFTALDQLRASNLIGVEREELVGSRVRRYYRLMLPSAAPGERAPGERAPGAPVPAAAGPDIRAGDADREAAAVALGKHFAEGRLTLDELNARLGAALTATTRGEIARATEDLPDPAEGR